MPEAVEARDTRELTELLDHELVRLPDIYREAVVCCDLEGRSRKEAARRLGCPEATLATRLNRGRRLLAQRLSARGAAVTAGALTVFLSQRAARAAVPAPLVDSTLRSALLTATGIAAGVPARVAGVSEGVVKAMLLSKLRILTAVVLAVGVLALCLCTQIVLAQKDADKGSRTPVPAAPKSAGKAEGAFRVLKADDGVVCLRYSPDRKALAIVTWVLKENRIDSAAQLWDVERGKADRTLAQTAGGGFGTNFHLRQVAFSADGKLLAGTIDGLRNANRYGEIKLWDPKTGEERQSLTHDSDIDCVAFTPDGKKVAGGGSLDGTVRIWKTADGAEERVINVGEGVRSVAISPDGKSLAAGCWKGDGKQGEVSLWDLETGQVKHRMTDQEIGLIYSVAFSPDGKKVAGGGWDKNVRVWEVETGLLKHVLEGPTTGFREVSFSPDGKLLAGAGPADVPVWDVESGKIVQTLRGHRGEVFSAVFSANGNTLTTCGTDKTIRFWRIRPTAGK
jgi:dipeptidyl aminopeptidase/acylaminoacyl peptidase